jgi:hypothetical protein
VIEEWVEKYEATSKRRRLTMAGVAVLVLVIVGIGLNTIVSGFMVGRHKAPGKAAKSPAAQTAGKTAEGDKLGNISEAGFGYLVPDDSPSWTLDVPSETYDSNKGVAKYNLKLGSNDTAVTISQQSMPAQLLPRTSAAFTAFVEGNKPTLSVEAGDGTLYFLPALQNGVQASGSDTVIYATDSVLMFGKSERVVGPTDWAKLMSMMKPAS